jgi:hypothetical protein
VIRLPLAQGMALSLSRDGAAWRIAAVSAPPKPERVNEFDTAGVGI